MEAPSYEEAVEAAAGAVAVAVPETGIAQVWATLAVAAAIMDLSSTLAGVDDIADGVKQLAVEHGAGV